MEASRISFILKRAAIASPSGGLVLKLAAHEPVVNMDACDSRLSSNAIRLHRLGDACRDQMSLGAPSEYRLFAILMAFAAAFGPFQPMMSSLLS
jgi:hypothetical protein